MAVHIHIYGGNGLRPRRGPIVLESIKERLRREVSAEELAKPRFFPNRVGRQE